jgi:hypothetical protein
MKVSAALRVFFVFLMVGMVAASCKPGVSPGGAALREINGSPVLVADLDMAGDTIDFDISAIVDSCRMVRLDNRKEALIGYIPYLAFTDDRIYIYNQERLLMAFDYAGNYREHLGNLGKGPMEYTGLNNIAAGGKPRTVLGELYLTKEYVLFNSDGTGRKVVPRRLDGSHFVTILPDSRILEFGYKSWMPASAQDEGIGLFIGDTAGNLLFEKGNVSNVISYRVGGVPMPICFYPFGGSFRVHFSRDTLFNLDIATGAITPVAVFTNSKNGFDYRQLDKELVDGTENAMKYTGNVYTEVQAETSDYFLVRQIRKGVLKDGSPEASAVSYFCIGKKDRSVHPVRLRDTFWGLDLDGDRSPMPFTHWKIVDNRYAVLRLQPIDLKEEIARSLKDPALPDSIKTKLRELDGRVKDEDNVALFVYYLKK